MRRENFATLPAERLVPVLEQKIKDWTDEVNSVVAMRPTWERNIQAYSTYMEENGSSTSSLGRHGEQGELVDVHVNAARSYLRDVVSLITKVRSSFQPIATANEAGVLEDTRMWKAIIDEIVTSQKVDAMGDRVVELSALLGASFITPLWRTHRGRVVSAIPGIMAQAEGKLEMRVRGPHQVIYQSNCDSWEDVDWIILPSRMNRWDLAAQYPDMAEHLAMAAGCGGGDTMKDSPWLLSDSSHSEADDDYVIVFEFFHRSTVSAPNGRYCAWVDSNIIFSTEDEFNPYQDDQGAFLPCVPMIPELLIGRCAGYAQFTNLLPVQEVLDAGFSTMVTNNAAFGLNTILNPQGNNLRIKDLGGLKIVDYIPQNVPGGGEPKAMNLGVPNPETIKMIDLAKGYMQELSRINSTLRGSPPPGVEAAKAISTLTTNAVELSQSLSKAYTLAMEQAMTMAIKVMAIHMDPNAEQSSFLEAQDGQTSQISYTSSKLRNLKRISIRTSNPVAATSAGRMELADKYIQVGAIKNAADFMSVVETGEIKYATDTAQAEMELIQRENAALKNGEQVPVIAFDEHPNHMLHHKALLGDPKIRENSSVLPAVLEHIQKHYELFKSTDPELLSLVNTGKIAQSPQGGNT